MRRLTAALGAALASLLLFAGVAQAAVPTVGIVGASDIQGGSALLRGVGNPEGLPTPYRFEYTPHPGSAGALKTIPTPAGSDSAAKAVRAAISDLAPNTTYYYRLTATNSSGSASAETSFVTTQG